MTASSLIVAVPWAIFCIGSPVVCLRLYRLWRVAQRPSSRPLPRQRLYPPGACHASVGPFVRPGTSTRGGR